MRKRFILIVAILVFVSISIAFAEESTTVKEGRLEKELYIEEKNNDLTIADSKIKGNNKFKKADKSEKSSKSKKSKKDIKNIKILSKTKSNVEQMQEWARNNGASETFINLAPIYMDLATKAGINPEGIYAQAAHETGYGNFGGVIDETYYNPCGLKIKKGGGNKDPKAHQKFKNWEEGIQAHIDHLALYAGASGYPKDNSPDPRHFPYLLNTVEKFRALGGKWAPSNSYGKKIEKLVEDVYNTSVD